MYIVGLDCGGTSSQALLATRYGQILGRGQGGPANYQVNGVEGVVASVTEAIGQALRDIELELSQLKEKGVVLALGVSGASRESEIQTLTRAFQQEGFPDVVLNHDASIALLGALSGSDGVAVISGTGSIAYGQRGERSSRVGGWGYILGDEGSAYWIALQALHQVMQGYDGRLPEDPLLREAVCQYFEIVKPDALIPIVYKSPINRGYIGGFSKIVTTLAKDGHQRSQSILAQAGRELGRLALASLTRLELTDLPGRVAACGGVFAAGEWILAPMQETIKQQAPEQILTLPDFEPVVGAVLLGIKHLHMDVQSTVVELRKSLLAQKEVN